MRSLRARLVGLWCLSVLSGLVLGGLLVGLYRQSAEAQLGRSRAVLARSCDLIRDRYGFYVAGWPGPAAVDAVLRRDLAGVVAVALLHQDGVEGGIWAPDAGSLAYAYPTDDASPREAELPAGAAEPVAALNASASRAEAAVERSVSTRSQTLLLRACPLEGPLPGATAWAMVRVQGDGVLRSVGAGLCILFLLLVLTSLLLWRTMRSWRHQVRGIEAALRNGGGDGALPAIPRPGERELDRIVDALNLAGRRLAEARRQSEALADQVARSERLAGLGRVAAGVAHEIRNPLAAARLQGENAVAGDDARRREAIGDMLEQLARLDDLVSELLAMTQRAAPVPVPVALAPFLEAAVRRHAAAAAVRDVSLATAAAAAEAAFFDPVMVGRILDNLLVNAVRHAPRHGHVSLSARADAHLLAFSVADNGSGVAPAMVDRLFEPFVTGRADGTGLGLAIARELADAHGGRLLLRDPGGDGGTPTDFTLELPQ